MQREDHVREARHARANESFRETLPLGSLAWDDQR